MKNLIFIILMSILVISGCARYATIGPEKLHKYSENKILAIKIPAKIAGVILRSEDTLYFDESNVFYYPKSLYKLEGITKNGEEFSGSIFSLKYLIITSAQDGKTIDRLIKPHKFESISRKWKINADSTAIMQDIFFYFDDDGGRVNSSQNIVHGQIAGCDEVNINIQNISKLKAERLKIGEKKYLFGLNSGPNFSLIEGTAASNLARYENDNNLHISLAGIKKFSQNIMYQIELSLVRYSVDRFYSYAFAFDSVSASVKDDILLSYIELPILARFVLPGFSRLNPSIYFGPSFGYLMSSKDVSDSTYIMDSEFKYIYSHTSTEARIANISNISFSAILGGELNYNFDRIGVFLDVRYKYQFASPLTNVLQANINDIEVDERALMNENGEADNIKFHQISVSLGLRYLF